MIWFFFIFIGDLKELALDAAFHGDIALVQKLVAEGLPLHNDFLGTSMVENAIKRGQEDLVSWLLDQGVDPCTNSEGETSTLKDAVPYPSILEKLRKYPFSKQQKDNAVYEAAAKLESLQLILEVMPSAKGHNSSVYRATHAGCWACAQLLLNAGNKGFYSQGFFIISEYKRLWGSGIEGMLSGATFEEICMAGTFPGHGDMMALAQELLRRRPIRGNRERDEILLLAAKSGCPHLMALLRRSGGKGGGFHPEILSAVLRQDITALEELLELGRNWQGKGTNPYDINQRFYDNNQTVLHFLYKLKEGPKRIEVFHLLVQNGANLDLRDNSGVSPSLRAFFSDDIDLLELFAEAGADWWTDSEKENSILYWVVKKSDYPALYVLVKNGCTSETINRVAVELGKGPNYFEKINFDKYIKKADASEQ